MAAAAAADGKTTVEKEMADYERFMAVFDAEGIVRPHPWEALEIIRTSEWKSQPVWLAHATKLSGSNVCYFLQDMYEALCVLLDRRIPAVRCRIRPPHHQTVLYVVGIHDEELPFGPFANDTLTTGLAAAAAAAPREEEDVPIVVRLQLSRAQELEEKASSSLAARKILEKMFREERADVERTNRYVRVLGAALGVNVDNLIPHGTTGRTMLRLYYKTIHPQSVWEWLEHTFALEGSPPDRLPRPPGWDPRHLFVVRLALDLKAAIDSAQSSQSASQSSSACPDYSGGGGGNGWSTGVERYVPDALKPSWERFKRRFAHVDLFRLIREYADDPDNSDLRRRPPPPQPEAPEVPASAPRLSLEIHVRFPLDRT